MSIKFMLYDTTAGRVVALDPLVSSMPADISGYYFAVATNEPEKKYGLVPDIDVLKKSSEVVIDTGNQTTTGVKATRTYRVPVPANMVLAGRVWLFGKSAACNQTANTGDKARVNLNLQKSGSGIGDVTRVSGVERVPNSTTEVTYTEILAIDLPATEFGAGDTLDIIVELEVTAVDSSNPGITFKLHCDPATQGNELVFYLQLT
ncbi:MAG: hypothetical protein DRJ47_06510 [Thermoprotei archaeon]|nr:MAG: hypothetical protein DRJ47_06510 [Thermoprotei archaeon]